MAQYSNLKAYIEEKIYENGTQAITGDILQDVLKAMTDDLGEFYQTGGVASPSTDPGTPDAKVIYIATEAGTYTNFGDITIEAGEVALLIFETSWTKETLNVLSSANGGVKTANLADGAVTTEKIAGGAVETAKIANNAVTSGKVADGAIGTAKIADGAIDADKIAANAVESAKIKNGAVTEGKINDGAVTAGKVAANAVTTAKIADDAVTTAKLNDGAVTEDKIATDAVTSGKVKDGAIGTAKIAAGAVTHAKIGAGAVEESNIKDGAVTSDKIANGAVGSDQLAEGAFSAENLADGSVTTDKLADDAVTAEKIADGAVTAGKFANGSVTTIKLGSGAVTTEKIGDGMVTRQKLADSSVGTSKIIDGAVTTDKVADGAITDAKLQNPVSVSQNTLTIGGEEKGELAGQLIENPEWLKVVTDSADKILYGVKTDGKFYFGNGCPPQVQEYVSDILGSYSASDYADIMTFLGTLIEGDTLTTLLETKVDKVTGKSLINKDYADGVSIKEVPEFIEIHTDKDDRILWAIRTDGSIYFGAGIPSQIVEYVQEKIAETGNSEYVSSLEFLSLLLDNEGKVLIGFDKNGEMVFGKSSQVENVAGNNIVTIIPNINWTAKKKIANDGLVVLTGTVYSCSNPIEVFAGDLIEVKAKSHSSACIISRCREDGYGVYDIRGRDDVMEPLVVASDSNLSVYSYEVSEHCFVMVCVVPSDYYYTVIKRKQRDNERIKTVKDYNRTKYGEQRHLYVDEFQFAPNTAERKYNNILTYSADDKYGSGTSTSSNYIVNAVAYPNGEIIACRNGGAVVKILKDGTEVPIQYDGADMVIQYASDWRGVFISKDLDVFISPHSSTGRGDNSQMNIAERGLYRIAYGSTTATKVLNLYNNVAVMVKMWEPNTAYSVNEVVYYINHCYKCTIAHTSGSEIDTTKFSRLPNWAKNTPYNVGDIVQYANNDYECISAHTSGDLWEFAMQNHWVAAASCMNGTLDTIWSMCEDDKGRVYAGVYAHTLRRMPVIYRSDDRGLTWKYIYNFATNAGVDIPYSWQLIEGPRHIHGITFNEYDNCLYCACGETNTLWRSADYGATWVDLKCGGYEGKPTSVIGVPDGVIMGSDGAWGCALTKVYSDGKTAKMVGRIWASFIFNIRRSDLTGWLYAFTRQDSEINTKGNGYDCPPVAAMTDAEVLASWKASVNSTQLANWQEHYNFCMKYYPDDSIIPYHAAILVSKDNGESWEILRYEDAGTNGNNGFATVGYFRDGECVCGLVTDGGRESGNVFVQPIVISEGKKKHTSDGYELTGEIYIKTNDSQIINY